MKKPLGIFLSLAGIALVIYGIIMFGDSGESASVLGVEMSVQDNDMRMQSFMLMGVGVISLLGGVLVMRKS